MNKNTLRNTPVDPSGAMNEFAEVGRLAILQELKVRLLANKTHGLENKALAERVKVAEDAIIEHFTRNGMLKPDEGELLTKSRRIRNKILHCEFDEAIKLIEALLGHSLPGRNALKVELPSSLSGSEMLDRIVRAQGILHGKEEPSAESGIHSMDKLSLKDGGLFGHMLHALSKGAFSVAREIFAKANDILDRVSLESALEGENPVR